MSLAAETRAAARERPFLVTALRAGIVNFTAAATWLADDVALDGDTEAVATALSRFADDLPPLEATNRRASVAMRSGVGVIDVAEGGVMETTDDGVVKTNDEGVVETTGGSDNIDEDLLLRVGDTAVVPEGDHTAIVATGDVDAAALANALAVVATADVEVHAAGVGGSTLIVVVGRRDGADAVRKVEAALERVPDL
ncbi:DUF7523 family protein [Haloparvum sp. AD34]